MATDSVNITCLQGRFPIKEPELSPPQTFYLFIHSVQMKQKLIFLASDLHLTVLFSVCIKNNHPLYKMLLSGFLMNVEAALLCIHGLFLGPRFSVALSLFPVTSLTYLHKFTSPPSPTAGRDREDSVRSTTLNP